MPSRPSCASAPNGSCGASRSATASGQRCRYSAGNRPPRQRGRSDHLDHVQAGRGVRAKCAAYGVGFVFTADDPFVGIDLDDCIENGELHPDAVEIVRQLDSYTELSPSGSGIHVIIRAGLNGDRHRTADAVGRQVRGLRLRAVLHLHGRRLDGDAHGTSGTRTSCSRGCCPS